MNVTNLFSNRKKDYFLELSIGGHLCVMFLLFFGKNVSNFLFSENEHQIIEEVIKVDVVGLPKLTLKELQDLKRSFEENEKQIELEANKKKLEEVKPEKIEIDKNQESIKNDTLVEKSNLDGLDLIKKLSNKKTNVQPIKKFEKKGKKGIGSANLNNLILEGNKISKGNSIKGRYQADVAIFDQYALNLPNVIRPFWKIPSYLENTNLNARVIIYINSDGQVYMKKFLQKSGNDDFDNRVIKSIENAGPFPVPDDEIRDRLRSEGIILGFPL